MQAVRWMTLCLLSLAAVAATLPAADPLLTLEQGNRIVLIGNTLAERMQYFGNWETLLHTRFPEHNLVVRNLGWSGDTITIRLRSQDFQDHSHTLFDHRPDVILGFFGFNESFAGPAGVDQFKQELATFIADVRQLKYPSQTIIRFTENPAPQDGSGEVTKTPKLVLVSPIANEDLTDRQILAGSRNNTNIALYAAAMQEVAEAHDVPVVDLFTPTATAGKSATPLTFNGIHLSESGDWLVAKYLDRALFGAEAKADPESEEYRRLRAEVQEKNLQHWYDYRAVNGYYIYGDRKKPFGVVNFPAEFAKLRKMVTVRDERIWKVARGEQVTEQIDDSGAGDFVDIETNFKNEVHITSPEEALGYFTLPEGFEINLWASEVEFSTLENPVQFAFDARGRMWIATMPTYPMYLPGTPVNDKVIILEDSNGDGQADTEKVFAEGLHLPTGIELGDGGVYLAQQPNLMFLRDADGDDRADSRELILHGFDSADSHHSIGAFEWGVDGSLYLMEGTFHHTQVETPYGPQRCANAAVYRYEPRTEKVSVFTSYSYANPWGQCWDKWGQNFIADASGGANYFAAAFSGDVDHPRKHPEMKQFLTKQWRPTCGCEIVSSRHFPDEMQGDYLLNNDIGFQGTLQYRITDEGSGYHADPVEPLLRSSDPNFRPVDLQFGPDGALYVLDWFNPLVGHMQHSIRDPNRDKHHGRIWRITYKNKPLLEPPQIAGQPIEKLLDLLKAYEYRTRYAARRELRSFPTAEVNAAIIKWIGKLDQKAPEIDRLKLEALWVQQALAAVDESLLRELLASPEPRVRASAVRVLCYQTDHIGDSLALLQAAVNDEHPRVRVEAVRALSFFRGDQASAARDIAYESLAYDQDDYLEYALKETLATLDARVEPAAE
ncbi:MAG: HEAT repeat domain-containing protein [Planctomycetaceae bacterium]|nr:HEAT repeat domain-containing protein [Planctomycetaceae bacterium]